MSKPESQSLNAAPEQALRVVDDSQQRNSQDGMTDWMKHFAGQNSPQIMESTALTSAMVQAKLLPSMEIAGMRKDMNFQPGFMMAGMGNDRAPLPSLKIEGMADNRSSGNGNTAVEGQGNPSSQIEKSRSKLLDANASPQERLSAARDLVKQNITQIDTTDATGKKSSLRLESEAVGGKNKEMVHVFVKDGSQKEQVALRGNFSGDQLEKQIRDGKSVSHEGRGLTRLNQLQTGTQREAERPAETKRPMEVKTPAEVKAPVETKTPVETKAPIEAKTPVETKAPVDTKAPAEREPQQTSTTDKPPQVKTKQGNKPIVVLDAGHGGNDTGAVVQGVKESEVTQALTKDLAQALRERNVSVELSNPHGLQGGPKMPLASRVFFGNSQFKSNEETRLERANREVGGIQGRDKEKACYADAFVSVHANFEGGKGNGNGSQRGFATYMYKGKEKDGTRELANSIQGAVVEGRNSGLDVVDGKVNDRQAFKVMREAQAPAVLLETGYLTNNRDRANLSDPEYRKRLAGHMADGIARFLNGRPERCFNK
ncbi:MAG: N-acetylmuramoyl-L-alanine amidase [Candidatus Obscuribacter sp.]|nr:N-acetylmuramoyl-L-alanine amidase [Candidatus Obscuribacter sp.]